jgi:hypothetical protein
MLDLVGTQTGQAGGEHEAHGACTDYYDVIFLGHLV